MIQKNKNGDGHAYLKYFFYVLSLPIAVENLFAESAAQTQMSQVHHDGAQAILWVILGIWFALSLYLLYIDRKITRLENHEKRN